jgi:hypothetical protein
MIGRGAPNIAATSSCVDREQLTQHTQPGSRRRERWGTRRPNVAMEASNGRRGRIGRSCDAYVNRVAQRRVANQRRRNADDVEPASMSSASRVAAI